MSPLVSPAQATLAGFPLLILSGLIPALGIGVFIYLLVRRLAPLQAAAGDARCGNGRERFSRVLSLWLGQVRQYRYLTAGIIHVVIFFGFLILALRALSLVFLGIDEDFVFPGLSGVAGEIYRIGKDIAATAVLLACGAAAWRRLVVKPQRYAVPEGMKGHSGEALLVLGLIAILMLSEAAFEASSIAAGERLFLLPLTLPWLFAQLFSLPLFSQGLLQAVHLLSYYTHDVVFFFFLCFLPLGKHFHVVTSLFNVWFMRLYTGRIKPVQYGIDHEQLYELESVGAKKVEDFTWKHLLDFYSCADCGRCSDNCPANAVGRPLSPRFLTIKGRDHLFSRYPLRGTGLPEEKLIGSIYSEDEIWSCTTCGACEQECPLGIEYIDKIVDLRRGMVDEGMVPQSLQAPLKALEKRGNPYGKMEKKRAAWTADEEFSGQCTVKNLEKGGTAETLYFVDSITSYEDRMQKIARAVSLILQAAGEDFGILGKKEKDSGGDVRRFGEELLFLDLQNQNSEAITACAAQRIVTADPHAMNTLKNEYEGLSQPVLHIAEFALAALRAGRLKLKEADKRKYTYHDPCYLGRHNALYDAPRQLLDAIPGLMRVEMERYGDRSFCCGGGGLMLFYEPEEESRMGGIRVQMAKDAGAQVIVTACPFCLVNLLDAVKTANLDKEIEVIDIAELVQRHLMKINNGGE